MKWLNDWLNSQFSCTGASQLKSSFDQPANFRQNWLRGFEKTHLQLISQENFHKGFLIKNVDTFVNKKSIEKSTEYIFDVIN